MAQKLLKRGRKLVRGPSGRKLAIASEACRSACGCGETVDPDCGSDPLHLIENFSPSVRVDRVRMRRDAVAPGTTNVKIDDACYFVIEPDDFPIESECGCVTEVDEEGFSCLGDCQPSAYYRFKRIICPFEADSPASGSLSFTYDDNDPIGSVNTSYDLTGTIDTATLIGFGDFTDINLRGSYSGTQRTRSSDGNTVVVDQVSGDLFVRVSVRVSRDVEVNEAGLGFDFEFITGITAIFPDGTRGSVPTTITNDGISGVSASWSGPTRFKNEDGTGSLQFSASWPEWLFPGPCATGAGGDGGSSPSGPLAPSDQLPGDGPVSALGAAGESRILSDLGIQLGRP